MKTNTLDNKALWALAMGGFGIGLTEFVIMGILPEVAGAMRISISEAGHFIAAYAMGVVLGAPLLTSLSKKWAPNQVLLVLMAWFTVFNTFSAFSESYGVMLLMRFLSGLPHGAFFGIGAVVAGKMAKEGKAAKAISIMFAGLTVANVIGVPIGTYVGHTYHWSASFIMVGIVGVLTMLSIYFWMPKIQVQLEGSGNAVAKGLKNSGLWSLIALTTIGTGGFFAWYSYIAPLLTQVAHLPESAVGYAMILSGLGMVVGNFLGAKMVTMFSPLKSVAISLSLMVVLLIINSVFAFNPFVVLGLTFIIGMISFTVATPLQIAIINASKGSEMLGSSLNQSAFNMGNASGAYLAGIPIAHGFGIASAGMVGALLAFFGVSIAIGLLVYSNQRTKKESMLVSQ